MSRRDRATNPEAFAPVVARSATIHAPLGPLAFDCVKLIVIRSGTATLYGEFGKRQVTFGDVVLLAASTLCGSVPVGSITSTTLYLDHDYVVDQVFWQHSAVLADRKEALGILAALYAEPAQILHLGKDRVGYLSPWLDELVSLSIDGPATARFFRMQSLLFAVVDVIGPFLTTAPQRATLPQRRTSYPAIPRHRHFAPLRAEMRHAADLLRADYERRWTLADLAREVHLSSSQLGRVFADSFGKSPIAYLTMIRVERMAILLRETDQPVRLVARQVGWKDPDYATRQFRRGLGMTPRQYRALSSRVSAGG